MAQMNKTRKLAAAAAAALVVAGGAWWALQPGDSAATSTGAMLGTASAETTAPADTATATVAGAVDPALLTDRSMGNPDAPIKMTEYASFTCPHCANFSETVFQKLKTSYIDTGKVHFTLREVYFDKFGLLAGMMARCGGTDRYFGFVETLFQNQKTWLAAEDPAVITENLKRIGRTGGMSDEQIDTCWANRDFANALVENFQKNMTADGIEGTPSFLIDGVKFSNMSYEEFAKVLDDKLQ